MDKKIRAPFVFIALILIIASVLLELGGTEALNATPIGGWLRQLQPHAPDVQSLLDETGLFEGFDISESSDDVSSNIKAPSGFGLRYLALLDAIYALTLISTAAGLVLPQALVANAQGFVSCFHAISTFFGGIVMIYAALAAVFLMIALLLAFPFGTIVYFIKFARFDRNTAMTILSLTMALKVFAVLSLAAAHQGFLMRLGLILLVLSSFIGNIIVSFLLALPPRFLVSITDAIAGIIVAICAVIWAIPLFIGAVIAIISIISFLRRAASLPQS